jgi:glycosyltransferase involved in cell wall biosynthesis
MRVLIAAPTYLPARRANTIQVMKMAQAVKALGNEVCVLVPDGEQRQPFSWDRIANQYGLQERFEIEWLQVNVHLRSFDYGFKVIQYFQAWGGDILYTRLPQAAAFASCLGIPTIYETHDMPGGFVGPALLRLYLKGKGARSLVVITQALKEAFHTKNPQNNGSAFTIVAPDGVDLERYKAVPDPEESRRLLQARKLHQLPVSQFTVGYSGHFYPGRGIEHIMAIASRSPDLTFLLVGGDPEAIIKIQEKVEVLALENIIITGFVPNAELPLYQAACDVLLMPYQRNVAASSGGDIAQYLSPMKMFEYLACGRVILSSDLPVLREVLNSQNSILLPPEDVDGWIRVLHEIKDDLPRRKVLMEQARKDSEKYTWESRAAKIFSVILQ